MLSYPQEQKVPDTFKIHEFEEVALQQHASLAHTKPESHGGVELPGGPQVQFWHVLYGELSHVLRQEPVSVKSQNGCTQHSLPFGEHLPPKASHHKLSHTQPVPVQLAPNEQGAFPRIK